MPFILSNGEIPSMDISPLDPKFTPTPVGPVPTPSPSVGMRATTIPSQVTTFKSVFPYQTILSMKPVNITAPFPGVLSGMVMGPSKSMKGSFKVNMSCQNAVRSVMDPVAQNGALLNSVGMNVVPSQVTVLNPTG